MTPEGGDRRRHQLRLRLARVLRRGSRLGGVDRVLRRLGLTRVFEERLLRSVFEDPGALVRIQAKGFDLDMPGTSAQGYLHERYEPTTLRWIEGELGGGEHCVDVGAHIGLTSLVMARATSVGGDVIACEPSPQTYEILTGNVRRSTLPNIRLVNAACGSAPGTAGLSVEMQSERSFIVAAKEVTTGHAVVRVETLDGLLPYGVEAFDFVKIDVEGYELQVLAGATRSINAARTSLVVEWNPSAQRMAGVDPMILPTSLVEFGYTPEVIDDRAGKIQPLDEVLAKFRSSGFPEDWYVNLVCRRTTPKLDNQRAG